MASIYSVTQLNTYIKNMFANDMFLNRVCVKGEVSNCKYHSSGHIYFTLKDRNSAISCIMFKSYAMSMDIRLKDGLSIVILGNVSVYDRDGKYQIYVNKVKEDGNGDLYVEYERLKNKLYEEGLFEFEDKKPIPKYPKKVGIVTTSTGAAIEDIKNIAKRRNPYVQLYLYPAKVQGDGAGQTIVRGIKYLDSMGLDTIIIGRGGGSIEDLWAFNEEIVARAIYEAHTPIISGTGHEVDNTIADYVADLRAPTPSAACELAIPDIMSSINTLNNTFAHMTMIMKNRISNMRLRLDKCSDKLSYNSPKSILKLNQIRIDDISNRLKTATRNIYNNKYTKYQIMVERLNGLSPTAKLINGFGYIDSDKGVVDTINTVDEGDMLHITIHDGSIDAKVAYIDKSIIVGCKED